MQNATLHLGRLTEHLLDARGERLGPVDDTEHAGLGGEPPVSHWAASAASATLTTATFFFTVVPP
jgi:hypothetical protein